MYIRHLGMDISTVQSVINRKQKGNNQFNG